MHNSLNERFFSFNSTVVIFRNLFRNHSGKRPESFKFWCLNSTLFIKFSCSTAYYTLHGPFEKKNKYYRPCSQNRESKRSVNDLAGFAVGVEG